MGSQTRRRERKHGGGGDGEKDAEARSGVRTTLGTRAGSGAVKARRSLDLFNPELSV